MVNAFAKRKVLITGHTGFKGSWLSIWLLELGAKVVGYSLDFPSKPNLCEEAKLFEKMQHVSGDIRDDQHLLKVFEETEPEYVFHLAAQALVRSSYEEPKKTFETNLNGLVHLLECVRKTPSVRVVLVVTSDKCYEDKDTHQGYKETDPLGGADPYSASKAACEIITQAYRKSFFPKNIATARSGNVIGGGDFGKDRLLPDAMSALVRREPIFVRHPDAVRPWLHLLDALNGYLKLASKMWERPTAYAGAWNFGPLEPRGVTVREMIEAVIKHWGEGSFEPAPKEDDEKQERVFLKLNSQKAFENLGWKPRWPLKQAIEKTVWWYQNYYQNPSKAYELCLKQIRQFTEDLK